MTMTKPTRKHFLPSTNKWAYSAIFRAVYDTARQQKDNLVELCCQATHCVRMIQTMHGEDNGLYAMFANCAGQDVSFMWHWVHFFIMYVYQTHFKCIGFNYLAKKGLDLGLWAEAIQDGWCPDFFVLYVLSALLEIHMIIHLKDGGILTMMENPLDHHGELLACCELHLAYMGHGLFVELVRRKHPLIIVNQDTDVKTTELACLTFDEEETLNYIVYHGIGKALGSGDEPSRKQESTVPTVKQEPPVNMEHPPPDADSSTGHEPEGDSVPGTESNDNVPGTDPAQLIWIYSTEALWKIKD